MEGKNYFSMLLVILASCFVASGANNVFEESVSFKVFSLL